MSNSVPGGRGTAFHAEKIPYAKRVKHTHTKTGNTMNGKKRDLRRSSDWRGSNTLAVYVRKWEPKPESIVNTLASE